jgi:hypothetical protein
MYCNENNIKVMEKGNLLFLLISKWLFKINLELQKVEDYIEFQ